MLRVLVKKELAEIFRSYLYNAKKNRANSKAVVIGYFLLFALIMVGLLGGIFTWLSTVLCKSLSQAGLSWLYFALMGLLALFLGTFGSVFNTFSALYMPKDNDLLLSLPIPVPVLMASRLLSVYLMGLMYAGVVIVPAVLVYWVTASAAPPAILGGLLLTAAISLLVLVLSCVLGYGVAKISGKLKNKSLITVLASLVFLGLYYFFYFRAQAMLEALLHNLSYYGQVLQKASPLYLFGLAGTGDGKACLLLLLVTGGLCALTWWVLSRSFLGIVTSSGSTRRAQYRERTAKPRSIGAALLQKEFGKFLSNPGYVLNCGVGCVLMALGGVALLWKGQALFDTLDAMFADSPATVTVLLGAMLSMLLSTIDTAAPSVSLEGKALWLSQSLPIKPWQVLRAKLLVQLCLSFGALGIGAGCIALTGRVPGGELLALLGLLLGSALLFALIGMAMGLKMPVLHWSSELSVIKQSACVSLTLLAGFGYTLVFVLLYLICTPLREGLGIYGYLGVYALVTWLACAGLLLWVKRRGCALFAAL